MRDPIPAATWSTLIAPSNMAVARARLKSNGASPRGFGSLMQVGSAADYRGKRVRMSAWVRCENVVRPSGLWMRIDGPSRDPSKPLASDAMQGRGIVGTRDWQRYEIVLAVAPEAVDIAFGADLSGGGILWVDDVQLEEVGDRAPTPGARLPSPGPRAKNLDLED